MSTLSKDTRPRTCRSLVQAPLTRCLLVCAATQAIVAGTAIAQVKRADKTQEAPSSKAQELISGNNQDFSVRVQKWLLKKDFDTLEVVVDHLRKTRPFYAEHFFQLKVFYQSLAIADSDPKRWEEHVARLEAWADAHPRSVAPQIALAESYIRRAWRARGGGFAGTVTDEGWKGFRLNQELAQTVLDKAKDMGGEKDPHFLCQRLMLLKGLQWSREEADEAVDAAIKNEPGYYHVYVRMAECLLPRWHGRPGDVEAFADDVAEKVGGDLGQRMYGRIVMTVWLYEGRKLLEHTSFTYDQVKKSLEALLVEFPKADRFRQVLAYFACEARDRETARKYFPKQSAPADTKVWGNTWRLNNYRRWVYVQKPTGGEKLFLWKHDGRVDHLTVSHDGRWIASVGRDNTLRLWNREGRQVARIDDPTGTMFAADFSPDGKLLAVGRFTRDKQESSLLVYSLKGDGQKWELPEQTQDVMHVEFSHDGKLLAAAGRDGLIRLVAVPEMKTLQTLSGKATMNVAFSPDDKQLFWEDANSLKVSEVATGKLLDEFPQEAGHCRDVKLGQGVGEVRIGIAALVYVEEARSPNAPIGELASSVALRGGQVPRSVEDHEPGSVQVLGQPGRRHGGYGKIGDRHRSRVGTGSAGSPGASGASMSRSCPSSRSERGPTSGA